MDGAIPVFRDHPEMAVVIIRSSLSNLTFSSNLQIIEQRSDPATGEYILIIEPVTQTIRVNAPGFLSGRISMRGLNARQVVNYSVEPIVRESEESLPVAFRIIPGGAAELALFYIEGELVDISRPVELEPGIYLIDITANGYRTLNETVEVTREQIFFEFTLEELQEEIVRIRTEPVGAIVFIDGIEQGNTDRSGLLEVFRLPGEYELGLFSSGRQSIQQIISVAENGDNTFSFDLESNTATLFLTVEPADARVTINRLAVNHSVPVDLSSGAHRLEVTMPGYDAFSENVIVERGQQIERTLTLRKQTGGLQFRVNPTFASIVLKDDDENEIDQWIGSRRIESLKTGIYKLFVSADGYEIFEEEFEIVKDEFVQKTILLKETQGIASSDQQESETSNELNRAPQFPDMTLSLPSKRTAITTSLILPGGGQIYSGRNRGYLYLLGGLASGGFAAWTFFAEGSIESDYRDALQRFSGARDFSEISQLSNEANQYYNDWNDLIDQRMIALTVFGGIYAIQLLDVLFATPERGYRSIEGNNWEASATGTGFRLRYSFN